MGLDESKCRREQYNFKNFDNCSKAGLILEKQLFGVEWQRHEEAKFSVDIDKIE